MPANPPPLDAAARDELAREWSLLVTGLENALLARERLDWDRATQAQINDRNDRVDAARAALTTPFLALLAAAQRGEEDTARINWLSEDCAQNCQLIDMVDGEWKATSYNGAGEIETTHATMRDAIDEAMAGQARYHEAVAATPAEGDDR